MTQESQSEKVPATPTAIVEAYKKLVVLKMRGGLSPDDAEAVARLQASQDHGKKAAEAALAGVVCEQAASARRADPFAGLAHRPVPPPTVAPVAGLPIQLPSNYRRLVADKRRAGLDREQAETVVRAQLEHEAQLAKISASKEKPKHANA